MIPIFLREHPTEDRSDSPTLRVSCSIEPDPGVEQPGKCLVKFCNTSDQLQKQPRSLCVAIRTTSCEILRYSHSKTETTPISLCNSTNNVSQSFPNTPTQLQKQPRSPCVAAQITSRKVLRDSHSKTETTPIFLCNSVDSVSQSPPNTPTQF